MSPKAIPDEVKDFIAERYEQLISYYNSSKCCQQIVTDTVNKFGMKVSSTTIYAAVSEHSPNGIHFNDFFDIMISDFKTKYGKNINQFNPDYLFYRIVRFIEREYGFGEKLNAHERYALSNVLEKRKDVVFAGKQISISRGKSKGKLSYFI